MPDWQDILSREGPAVWRTAYCLLGHHADADECFQETCLAALEVSRRQPVRYWRALLRRLATTQALNRLRDRYRRGRHERPADLSAVPGPAPTAAQAAEEAELAEELRQALTQLPQQQAEAFCLHALDGWSYRDVAEQLGLSIDAVGVLLHRARQRLRALLADTLDAPAVLRKEPT